MSKILIVDDEMDLLDLVKNRLEANHFDVIMANDGEEALFLVKQDKPDLILLDVSMPVIDGYEVCSRLKSDVSSTHIPVIMLTARNKYSDKKIADHCRADGFVAKPFNAEVLLDEINKFLKGKVE